MTAINNAVAMPRHRHHLAPLNHRATAFAIGTASITVLRASRSLVFKRNSFVLMPGIDRVIQHGFNGIATIKGRHFTIGVLHIAITHIVVNRDNRTIA